MKQNKLTSQKPQWDVSLMLQQINKPNYLHVRISLRGLLHPKIYPYLLRPPQSRSGRRKRPCIWSIPCLMFSNCDI